MFTLLFLLFVSASEPSAIVRLNESSQTTNRYL